MFYWGQPFFVVLVGWVFSCSIGEKSFLVGLVVSSEQEGGSTAAFRNRIACPDDAGHRDVTSCKTREV